MTDLLNYLHTLCGKWQVINESLRLANVSPGFLRRATKDVQVNGTVKQTKTQILHYDSKGYCNW